MKKARFIPLGSTNATATNLQLCEKEGCKEIGLFRAPKNPHNLREYYLFCLNHVREYNKSWDFYKGMTPAEIEASRVSDMTWNRPSWPIGGWQTLLENAQFFDGIDPFLKISSRSISIPQEVKKSLGVLELELPLKIEVLKKQYKKLAKRYHPDLNPNDKRAEERLKMINEAYQVVKKYLGK